MVFPGKANSSEVTPLNLPEFFSIRIYFTKHRSPAPVSGLGWDWIISQICSSVRGEQLLHFYVVL